MVMRARGSLVATVISTPSFPDSIERRGPGLHHIAYRVPDVARAMDELAREGYEFTSDGPMTGRGGHRIAFVHPRSTGGVLTELVERA